MVQYISCNQQVCSVVARQCSRYVVLWVGSVVGMQCSRYVVQQVCSVVGMLCTRYFWVYKYYVEVTLRKVFNIANRTYNFNFKSSVLIHLQQTNSNQRYRQSGQWLWLSWQSCCFRHPRSAVQIQSLAKFLLNIVYCQLY